MTQSIRETIAQKSLELQSIDSLGALREARSEDRFTNSSLALNAYVVEKRFAYNGALLICRNKNKSAADAKIAAESSEAWKNWQDAEAQKDALIELIRSVKYYLKSAEQEARESRY